MQAGGESLGPSRNGWLLIHNFFWTNPPRVIVFRGLPIKNLVQFTIEPLMIALEVRKNGKVVCLAGAEDLAVLSAEIAAVGQLGMKTVPIGPDETPTDIYYTVGGLTSRPDPDKDVHVTWQSVAPLKVGDIIEVRILETQKADRAKSRIRANKIDA